MAEVRYRGRILVLAILVLLVFVGIGVRLCAVQLRPADWVLEPMQTNRKLEDKPVGSRGRIVDRNGVILAMDIAAYNVCLDPLDIHQNGDPEAVVHYLSKEFNIPEQELRASLSDPTKRYVAIRKRILERKLKRFERRLYGVSYTPPITLSGGPTNVILRGVTLEETSRRSYPQRHSMSHVVGFSNVEGVGSAGIELRMDKYLQGIEGRRESVKDGRRREIYKERTVDIPPKDGATVTLTLDQELQYRVERTIEKMCAEYNAKSGWAIVQKVSTGEILAMASFPTYDLNRYSETPPEWMRNRAIGVNYEPGSVMKAAMISSALDLGVVYTNNLIDCENGSWFYGGRVLRDDHNLGEITVADVVKYSSNIGTAKIAMQMGDQKAYETLRKFHFGQRLGMELPGEETGIVNALPHWSKISITRVGMGHEVAVTALQMVSMMSAIAYNGVQMKPYVVKKVVSSDGQLILENHPEELGRPLNPPAAKLMRALLERVTEDDGTAPKARVEGYRVAGKTGTAQKVRPKEEGGGYYQKNFVASFAGFIPADAPEISIIVVADDPGIYDENGRKTKYFGGTVCAPAFSEIAEYALRYLRIAPDGNRIYLVGPNP